MSMQRLTYLSGGLPGLILSPGTGVGVPLRRPAASIHGTLTLGTFVAFMAYQMRVLPPLQALMGLYASLATARVSLRRVSEILDAPVEVVERAGRGRACRRCAAMSSSTTSRCRSIAARPVLEQLSFAVQRRRGAGDRRAERQRQVDDRRPAAAAARSRQRRVRLDGHDLRDCRLDDLRRHVALVDQEPCMLHATIAENIRYARPEATDARAENRGAAGRARRVHQRSAARVRHDRRRARPGAVGRRAAAHRDGARVSRRPGRAGARRADRGAGPRVRAPGRRGLRGASCAAGRRSSSPIGSMSPPRADRTIVVGDARARRAGALNQMATGRGVRVAIVDSGVHASHPHVGHVAGGIAIDGEGRQHEDFVDRLGHGTAVAAAIREKAPDADLFAVKVFDRALSTSIASLVDGIDWAAHNGMHLVNLSLGTPRREHETALAGAVERAARANMLVVAARQDAGQSWLPGSLAGVLPVEVDWTLPRDRYRSADRGRRDGVLRVRIRARDPGRAPRTEPARHQPGGREHDRPRRASHRGGHRSIAGGGARRLSTGSAGFRARFGSV